MSFVRPLLLLAAGVLSACSPSNGQDKGGHGGPGGMPAAEVNAVTVEPKAFAVVYE